MRVTRKNIAHLWSILTLVVGFLAPITANASAQMPMPGVSLQGEPKRRLTPEEEERQKKLDGDYKAATKKIPNQTVTHPWASVRATPAMPNPKKKQQ
jgi:hypothetical protein